MRSLLYSIFDQNISFKFLSKRERHPVKIVYEKSSCLPAPYQNKTIIYNAWCCKEYPDHKNDAKQCTKAILEKIFYTVPPIYTQNCSNEQYCNHKYRNKRYKKLIPVSPVLLYSNDTPPKPSQPCHRISIKIPISKKVIKVKAKTVTKQCFFSIVKSSTPTINRI